MNSASIFVRYHSLADKARRYIEETIPAIFEQAREISLERRFWAIERATPAHIHEAIRAQVYEAEHGPLDEVENLGTGGDGAGDCEDYAALMLAEYARHGYPVRLVTAGDSEDNFRHAYVELFDNANWIASDPKGSQRGKAFGDTGSFEVHRYWTVDGSRVIELSPVAGSSGDCACGDVAGSGYDNIDEQAKKYASAKYAGGTLNWGYLPSGTREIITGTVKDRVVKRIADGIPVNVSRDIWNLRNSQGFDLAKKTAEFAKEGRPLTPQEIAILPQVNAQAKAQVAGIDDDKFVSGWMAAQFPLVQLLDLTGTMGVTGDEAFRRAAMADAFTVMAKSIGKSVRAAAEMSGLTIPTQDDPDLAVPATLAGSGGFFDKLGDKFQGAIDKGGDILRAVQTGVGVALQQVGRGVLKLGDRQPWFNQFVSKPLGFHLMATAVSELGNAIRDGSINTFDEKKLGRSTASWFTAVGAALAVAAPFTGPWAPLFAVCSAINIAVGKTLGGMIDRAEAARKPEQSAQMYVDQYGRRVDSQGNLLDPQQRAIVAALKESSPQFEYAQRDYGEGYGVLWTAFDSAGVPRFAEFNGQWWPLSSAA